MFDYKISKEEIIRIVGKALEHEGSNGNVGVYDYTGKIVLWDMVKSGEKRELEKIIIALLDYLKLEVVKSGEVTLKKKKA